MSISRFFASKLLSFDEVELFFESGLTVFTGASGSGKSVLMEGLLSTLGYREPRALSAETSVDMSIEALEEMGIDGSDSNTFRYLKKEKTRFFINGRGLSKKEILSVSKRFSSYLSSSEEGDFESKRLLAALDSFISDPSFAELMSSFKSEYKELATATQELAALRQKALRASEEREFLEAQLRKFNEIAPREGEEEELLLLKKEVSKKEKISALISKLTPFLSMRQGVEELFAFCAKERELLDDFFAALEDALSQSEEMLSRLDGIDIDALFDRLEKLSYLSKRYGSISGAIEYFENKKRELKELEDLDSRISLLELEIRELKRQLNKKASEISALRREALPLFSERMSFFASKLLLPPPSISLFEGELRENGMDEIAITLGGSPLSALSAGEYRRLRLVVLACEVGVENRAKVLFLDEADANLSGKESAGVAFLLKELSKSYQIFAISHQPQLASVADNHFLVFKEGDKSFVKRLSESERVYEIARMVSSGKPTKEALEYAKQMLKEGLRCQ